MHVHRHIHVWRVGECLLMSSIHTSRRVLHYTCNVCCISVCSSTCLSVCLSVFLTTAAVQILRQGLRLPRRARQSRETHACAGEAAHLQAVLEGLCSPAGHERPPEVIAHRWDRERACTLLSLVTPMVSTVLLNRGQQQYSFLDVTSSSVISYHLSPSVTSSVASSHLFQ